MRHGWCHVLSLVTPFVAERSLLWVHQHDKGQHDEQD